MCFAKGNVICGGVEWCVAEMGPIINGETTIVLDFSLIIQKIIVLVLKDQDG